MPFQEKVSVQMVYGTQQTSKSHRKVIKSTALKEKETDSEDSKDTNMLKHVNAAKEILHAPLASMR